MDWHNQPNPFRHYEGTEQTQLALGNPEIDISYRTLFTPPKSRSAPLNLRSVGSFCELSLGLSAWKQAGANRWALRINPSSGNLHPTEGYLMLPDLAQLAGGVFHYAPLNHVLERRAFIPDTLWSPVRNHFGANGFGVSLTSIFWRESWKYGERAFRYCNLDIGHALAALVFAARLHHWQCWTISGAGDRQIATMLGLNRTPWWPLEQEVPEVFCWVVVDPQDDHVPQVLPDALTDPFGRIDFMGRPNRLSPQAVDWDIIDEAAAAAGKPATHSQPVALVNEPLKYVQPDGPTATEVIRQRRSAVAYDPSGFIPADTLWAILDPTLARAGIPPFNTSLMAPAAHLLVFVHRVVDVPPGLYLLARGSDDVETLQSLWRSDFLWQSMMADWPLYLLLEGDVTMEAMEMSCHQEIAGNSAFAVSMLVPFEDSVRHAPYRYRYLHWECGMLGQVLYLGAEAHGIRGTGIGCFFDDEVHRLLGIQDRHFQSLYHFTVGYPIEDGRLTTLPPYHHLKG